MHSQKMKYQEYLKQFSNCPPTEYKEVEMVAFRWVFENCGEESFIPILVINPLRKFDDNDMNCKGYGLSMFATEIGAYERYKKQIHKKPKLKETLGSLIAKIKILPIQGIGSEPENNNYTHFTFHEYEGTDLTKNIVDIINIFDENGNFKT